LLHACERGQIGTPEVWGAKKYRNLSSLSGAEDRKLLDLLTWGQSQSFKSATA